MSWLWDGHSSHVYGGSLPRDGRYAPHKDAPDTPTSVSHSRVAAFDFLRLVTRPRDSLAVDLMTQLSIRRRRALHVRRCCISIGNACKESHALRVGGCNRGVRRLNPAGAAA
jgi:hypothetical protein